MIILLVNFNCAYAEEAKGKILTREEVIEKISAADFIKKKIGDLLNWSVGYDITKINRTNLAPTISWIKVTPDKVPPDDRTVVMLTTRVSDPSGFDNIRGIRADLSSIAKLPNTMLVDNGLWGDVKASDGIYTLQTSIGLGVSTGTKDVPVAVANKLGWVAISKTNIDVETNPVISEGRATPPSVNADGNTDVLLTVKIENPGKLEDIKEVTVDLITIGLGRNVKMWDDGTNGDAKAGDGIFSVTVTPREGTSAGMKKLAIKAVNFFGGSSDGEINLMVE